MPSVQKNSKSSQGSRKATTFQNEFTGIPSEIPLGNLPPLPKPRFQYSAPTVPKPNHVYMNTGGSHSQYSLQPSTVSSSAIQPNDGTQSLYNFPAHGPDRQHGHSHNAYQAQRANTNVDPSLYQRSGPAFRTLSTPTTPVNATSEPIRHPKTSDALNREGKPYQKVRTQGAQTLNSTLQHQLVGKPHVLKNSGQHLPGVKTQRILSAPVNSGNFQPQQNFDSQQVRQRQQQQQYRVTSISEFRASREPAVLKQHLRQEQFTSQRPQAMRSISSRNTQQHRPEGPDLTQNLGPSRVTSENVYGARSTNVPYIKPVLPIKRSKATTHEQSSNQISQLYPSGDDEASLEQRGKSELAQQGEAYVPTQNHHHHHHHHRSHSHHRLGSLSNGFALSISNPSDEQPSSPSQQNRRSPILRQSLSFLHKNRTASSSSLASEFSAALDLGKYHSSGKAATAGGRIIPQRIDVRGSQKDRASKSRSFSSITRRVTSAASFRNSGDKERVYSTGSLSSRHSSKEISKKPSVYPAMLSEVARAFRDRIQLGTRYKNGLEYRDAFTGAEAVDIVARIIRTSDRNLALLLGRSLDAQKFYHDVTYEHRLRDSTNEVYQFSEDVFSPYGGHNSFNRQNSMSSNNYTDTDGRAMIPPSYSGNDLANRPSDYIGVNGVFTLLTECYSPTCSRDNLCYSIACPRRLEQQARLSMKSGSLTRSDSRLSLNQDDHKPYWQLTVPKSLLESLDKKEIKRQECIFETIYSERDFVKDLEYLREFWIRPLSETKIIRQSERDHFVKTVFYGINEIWEINLKFAEALTKRQQEDHVVKEVGDIFLEFIPRFEPFIKYGAGQVMGRYEFDRQKRHNPFFVRFIEDTSNRAESRRLDVSSYLSKPTTRPARYPLLLRSIRNHTAPDSKDYENLGKAMEMLEKMLKRINFETGKASDRLNLFLLKQKLVFRPGELVDLKLTAENRKLLYQCTLKKKNAAEKDKAGEIQAYLFDHALLLVKVKVINKREVYRVYQRPMPIPLMFLSLNEEAPTLRMIKRAASTGTSSGSTTTMLGRSQLPPGNFQLASTAAKSPISFTYIGRNGYKLTLYATPAIQRMLVEKIETQSKKMIEDNDVFTLTPLNSNYFDANNKINCVVPFDGGRKLLYGTDSGIYISDVITNSGHRTVSKPTRIISKINIIQADILGEYQVLLALSDKKLFYWPLDVLRGGDANKNAKIGKELMSHVSFFKIGVCSGRMLVCAAKSSSNMIRVFEPIDPINQRRQKKKFRSETKDVNFGSEPVSVNFLKTKLCVGCSRGFEIVSLDNNVMEQLLDPADTSLDFAIGREGLKPLEIDRINSDFLLSYSSFSFFINHNGWRSRPKWIIHWEGVPHAFALWYPYLLAFDNNMIEIRHVETGDLLRVIVAENIRFLHSSSQEILYAYEDERGYDVVASLDFWDKTVKNNIALASK